MMDLLRRLRHWIRKPKDKYCHEFCPTCKYFQICIQDIGDREVLHQNHTKRITYPVEFRCSVCKNQNVCPAYYTGVIFPCPYFTKEDTYENEE